MANLITSLRFLLLFAAIALAYEASPWLQMAAAPLLVVVFSLDGVDGLVARARGESSLFGSIFDIAVDRIVENVLWLVVVDLTSVPVWVAIVFITRGFLVDYIRSYGVRQGQAPFDLMQSLLGRFLVRGRVVRFTYAAVKMLAFTWILLIRPWPALFPELWAQWGGVFELTTAVLVYLSLALCLARGLPVIIEFMAGGADWLKPGSREPSS